MRIVGAGHHPIWSDEAWNIWASDSGVPRMLERLAANHHPPSFFFGLGFWEDIGGHSRLALRLVSIAAGMLAVALIYRTGADNFGTTAGLCAALVFAVFEQPVYYGQSVRHYAWLLLAEALALWAFLRALRQPTWRRFAVYGASVAFIAYTMYIGLLIAALQGIIGLFVWRAPLRLKARLIAAYIGAFVVFLPWLIVALPGALHKIDAGVITGYVNSIPTTGEGVLRMADILLGGQAALGIGLFVLAWGWKRPVQIKNIEPQSTQRAQRNTEGDFIPLTPQPPLPQGARGRDTERVDAQFFTSALGTQHSALSTSRLALLTVLLCSAGALAIMAAVNLRVGVVSERTLSFMLPAVALSLGAGTAALPRNARTALIGALVVWSILTPQHIIPRLNSDLAARTVAAGYSPGDLVVLETGFDDMAFAYEMEYALPEVARRRIFPTFSEYKFPSDAAMLESLDAELAVSERVWLVYWNVPPRLDQRVRAAGFTRTSSERIPIGVDDPWYVYFPTIEISRYVRPSPAETPTLFGDTLRLLDVIVPRRVPQGSTFSADMVWQPDAPLPLDYTTALFLLDATGATVLETFGPDAAQPATTWPVDTPTIDTHRFALPPDVPPGRYTLYAVVYWYQTVDTPLPVEGQRGATVAEIEVR